MHDNRARRLRTIRPRRCGFGPAHHTAPGSRRIPSYTVVLVWSMNTSAQPSRLVVIGGGPAGYPAAFHAADLGLRVTLVDLEEQPGGVCLHRGCIPSKALLHIARFLAEAAELRACGVQTRGVSGDHGA